MEKGTPDTQPNQPLLASIPHTVVLCILVLAPVPIVNWLSMLADLRHPLTLSRALLVVLLLQWSLVSLTWFGIALRRHQLRELFGKTWRDLRDFKNDFIFACVLVLLLALSTFFVSLIGLFDTYTHTSPNTPVQLMLSLFVALSAGLTEELIFRGYMLRQFALLARSEKTGLLVQAVLFALAHGSGQTFAGILHKFLTGYFFGWSATRRRSLGPGVIAHCGLNAFATILPFLLPATLHS